MSLIEDMMTGKVKLVFGDPAQVMALKAYEREQEKLARRCGTCDGETEINCEECDGTGKICCQDCEGTGEKPQKD